MFQKMLKILRPSSLHILFIFLCFLQVYFGFFQSILSQNLALLEIVNVIAIFIMTGY